MVTDWLNPATTHWIWFKPRGFVRDVSFCRSLINLSCCSAVICDHQLPFTNDNTFSLKIPLLHYVPNFIHTFRPSLSSRTFSALFLSRPISFISFSRPLLLKLSNNITLSFRPTLPIPSKFFSRQITTSFVYRFVQIIQFRLSRLLNATITT